jgi:hypothetical protein
MTVTRLGVIATIVALSLPVELSAQRLPVPGTGRRGPARPAPLPPQPEPIARNLAYKRMRLAVESYPLVSYFRAPGFAGGPVSGWGSFGSGTRAEYRLSRHVAATFDLTSSFAGGPADVHTAELGTRLRPERSARRAYPFADLRVGYVLSHTSSQGGIGAYAFPTADGTGAFRYSEGYGLLAGAGMEYDLTRRFSLTTAASVMRNRMTTHTLLGGPPSEWSYGMTLFRYTIGIKYNPIRVIRGPGTDTY